MDRSEALERLRQLAGHNVQELAAKFDIPVRGASGRVNKGWAGHAVERFLGLQRNSAQSPNFGSWELKVVPLKRLRNNNLVFKETMAITMIDPHYVANTPFDRSHMKTKLDKAVVLTRIVGSNVDAPSTFHSVFTLDLRGAILHDVEQDYREVQRCLLDPNRGFDALTGRMGKYVQPRTKGSGHGSTSRAFYARKILLQHFANLE